MITSSVDAGPRDDASATAVDAVAISAAGVSKRYGPVMALDGLDARHTRRRGLRLAGAERLRQDYFMRLLAGYLLPSAGRLTVAGLDAVREFT